MKIKTKLKGIFYPIYFVDGVQTCCAKIKDEQYCYFLRTQGHGLYNICTMDYEDLPVYEGPNGYLVPHTNCQLKEKDNGK